MFWREDPLVWVVAYRGREKAFLSEEGVLPAYVQAEQLWERLKHAGPVRERAWMEMREAR